MRGFVPMQARNLPRAFFVCIGNPIVKEERKVRIGSRIDAHLRDRLFLVRAFNFGTERNDGSCTNEKRNGIDGSGGGNSLAASYTFICPVVVPVCAGRQVNL